MASTVLTVCCLHHGRSPACPDRLAALGILLPQCLFHGHANRVLFDRLRGGDRVVADSADARVYRVAGLCNPSRRWGLGPDSRGVRPDAETADPRHVAAGGGSDSAWACRNRAGGREEVPRGGDRAVGYGLACSR